MGDGLFWERKCGLSSERQFPVLGTFAFFFFLPLRAEEELAGVGYTCSILSLVVCLSLHLKLGVKSDLFQKFGNRSNK